METFLRDLRYAARALARTPGFATVAVLTLALGVGANAAIFSVARAVLLAPLPYADPERTVAIWSRWTGWDKTWVSEAELLDYRQARSLRDVGAWDTTQANLTGSNGRSPSSVRIPLPRWQQTAHGSRTRSTAAGQRVLQEHEEAGQSCSSCHRPGSLCICVIWR